MNKLLFGICKKILFWSLNKLYVIAQSLDTNNDKKLSAEEIKDLKTKYSVIKKKLM